MLIKNNSSRLITFCLTIVLLLVAVPIRSFAAEPWEPYEEYLPENMPIVKRHLRGAWVSTTLNLDWPSTEIVGIENDDERMRRTKDELVNILDKAVDMNMNAIFLQVSPEGDAFYKSEIVPWSRYLTKTFGKNPGFDPLAFAVEEAHKRNLEIHAWFNPYRISMYTDDATVQSLNINKSVYKEHPDWIRTAHSKLVVDPGIPETKEWVKRRVMEVVKNYDIDGIHFDDYFYNEAYAGELDDQDTYLRYNSGKFSNKEDWRRNNTYILIKELSEEINNAKSWVKFGVSPAAVWGNKKDGHPDGSDTNAGLPNYDRAFADTKRWINEEIIDYIAPQVYFSFANPHVPYGNIISWWSNVVRGKNVHLYVGQALYKVNSDSDEYFKNNEAVEEFTRQHKFNVKKPEVMGSIMFRFKNFHDSDKQQVANNIQNELWSTKALVPVMDWKGGLSPQSPAGGEVESLSNGNKLTWIDNDDNTAYYAIYRINKGDSIDINSDNSVSRLIETVRKGNKDLQEFIDKGNYDLDKVEYAVTALDRLHHESKELIISKDQSKYFTDVNRGNAWAIEAIDYLYENGIINGIGNNKFAPGNNVTRADFLIMAMNSYDIEPDSQVTDNFSDARNRYYTDYLGTAKRLGLVLGVGNNCYLPENKITRQEMFVILYRIMDTLGKLPDSNGNSVKELEEFSDINEIDGYAMEAIRSFVESGIVQGDNNRLRPKSTATRAEAAQIIYNIIKK